MKILFDILHPGHVHLFKNLIKELENRGHQIVVTSRDKEHTIYLLDKYGIKHTCLSKISNSKIGLGIELLTRMAKLILICQREKPDLLVGVMGAVIAPVGKLLGIPSHTYYDTENARLTNRYVYKLTTKFITPSSYLDKVPEKIHVKYNGFHDLAYLHPDRFQPDKNVLHHLDINPDEPFFIVRFVSWQASHDIGQKGLSYTGKLKLIKMMNDYGKVLITSETELPAHLEPYRIKVPPHQMHDVLYFATLYVGEGGTMASEAAVLGTPSVFINSLSAGVFQELENRYELMFSFTDENKALEKVKDLLSRKNLKKEWFEKRSKMLREKIDVTSWMLNFIEDK